MRRSDLVLLLTVLAGATGSSSWVSAQEAAQPPSAGAAAPPAGSAEAPGAASAARTPPEVTAALQRRRAGDLAGAIAVLEPFRGDAAHPAALSLLGTLYLESGRAADALVLLAPLADAPAAGPLILRSAANAALAAGQGDRAERWLERIVAQAPESRAARDLGILRGSHGRVAEGYALLRPWALAHADDVEARLSAAFAAIELDRPPEASELLAGLPETDPRAQLLRGRLRLIADDPAGAAAILEPLAGTAAADLQGQVRRYLAQAWIALGKSERAVALLDGRTGDDRSLVLLLARAHFQAGAPDKSAALLEPLARELLARAPAASPESIDGDLALAYGQALVSLSRWPQAIEALGLATRLLPDRLDAWQLLSRAQLAAGQREQANASLARLQELQQKRTGNAAQVRAFEEGQVDPTARNLERAAELAAAGRFDEALAMIRQERTVDAADPRPRTAEVITLAQAGRRAEALRAAGDDAALLTAAAEQLAKSGRVDDARALLARALELRPGDARATAVLQTLHGS